MAVRLLSRVMLQAACRDATYTSPCVIGSRAMSRKKQPNQAKERAKWMPRSLQAVRKNVRVMPKDWDQFLARTPEDDVWIKMYFPPSKYSFHEVVEMHREVAMPEMMNNMNGLLQFYAELNMKTSKTTKFLSAFNGLVNVPHYFVDGTENKVLAFCKTKDEQRLAMAEGAAFAGGSELMAMIESGEVRSYMFDHAVCTSNFIEDVTKIRKHIKDKFPNKRNGAIGPDVGTLVKHFRYGKNYSCTKPNDEMGIIKVTLGVLDMPTEHLYENFRTFIDAINSHRSSAKTTKVGGPFITKAYCHCPPSGERLHLKEEEIVSQVASSAKKPIGETHQETADDEEQEHAAAA